MMPFLARQPYAARPLHAPYHNFTETVQRNLRSSAELSSLATDFGSQYLYNAVNYDRHNSLHSLEKALSVSMEYATQGVEKGHIISSLAPPPNYSLTHAIETTPYKKAITLTLEKKRPQASYDHKQMGYVRLSHSGSVLTLEEEYKNALPTLIAFDTVSGPPFKISSMAYLTQKAIRMLVQNPADITHFHVSRLQNRKALAHIDWLLRSKKTDTLAQALTHTTWYKRMHGLMEMAGLHPHHDMNIILPSTPLWKRINPSSNPIKWNSLLENDVHNHIDDVFDSHMTYTHDSEDDWMPSTHLNLQEYLDTLPREESAALEQSLDNIIHDHYALEAQYNIPPEGTSHFDFDIFFKIVRHSYPSQPPYSASFPRS